MKNITSISKRYQIPVFVLRILQDWPQQKTASQIIDAIQQEFITRFLVHTEKQKRTEHYYRIIKNLRNFIHSGDFKTKYKNQCYELIGEELKYVARSEVFKDFDAKLKSILTHLEQTIDLKTIKITKDQHLAKHIGCSSYFIVAQLLLTCSYLVAANDEQVTSQSNSLVNNSAEQQLLPVIPVTTDELQESLNFAEPIQQQQSNDNDEQHQDEFIPAYEVAIKHYQLDLAKFILEQGKQYPISIQTLQMLYDAKQNMVQENYSEALKLFNQVIDVFSVIETPNQQVSEQQLNRAFAILKEYQDILAICHQQIAKIYAMKGDFKEASINSLVAVLYATPKRISFYIDYIQYLFELEKYPIALDFIERSFEYFPNHPLLLQWQIKVLEQLKQQRQVKEATEKLNMMVQEPAASEDEQGWSKQIYLIVIMILGFIGWVFGLFIIKRKIGYLAPKKAETKNQARKIKKMDNNQQYLINHFNLLLERAESGIKKLDAVKLKIEQKRKQIQVLEHEVNVMLNLSKKYLRNNMNRNIEQFQKHHKHFDSVLVSYFNLEQVIQNELAEVECNLILLCNQLHAVKESKDHSSQELIQLEQLIFNFEQNLDFKIRLEKAYEHVEEIYRRLDISFQKLKEEPKYWLERMHHKNKAIYQEVQNLDCDRDADNNNNNEAKQSKKF